MGGQVVRVKVDAGKAAARTGNRAKTWKNMGLRQLRSRAHNAVDCFGNSYGDVHRFFATNPCRSLNRALFVLSEGSDTIVLSVSWVRMPNAAAAERLQTLADRHGTGNVSPIALSLLQVSGVGFTGHNYGSRRLGPLVVIAETEPVTGSPDPAFLDGIAEAAALLPPPRR
ncbi:hypothetical protein ACFPM7_03885 [Actinokineospora guangxiensis]|uniref:Uncharacterized protein n=1 Tax=Actinokineospora guangxiensis TaxID=1490288 RepID=A0ABW0EIX0_9PSEU